MPKKVPADGRNQELYIGLVRLHVLHHAAEERSSASGSSGSWAATDTASVQERYTHFFTAWSGADGCARACNWSKADGVKLMPRQARAVAR